MKYKLKYEKPATQYIPIEARIPADGNETELIFPAWRPGRYELGNFAKNVLAFKCFNNSGKPIKAIKISKNKWRVETADTQEIRVTYKYFAAELNAGSTYMDDRQLYVNPVNCLVYSQKAIDNPCELSLDIPENFTIACAASAKNNIIRTKDYHELVDSPFIAASQLKHKPFKCGGIEFHLWFMGDLEPEWDRMIKDFKGFTKAQLDVFDSFPVKSYHYLFQILNSKAYHGVEHQQCTVIALGPTEDIHTELYDDLLGVSSHELYHTWNVKHLRPKDWMPYDYSAENYSVLGFVAEGVTTYMGDLFIALSGVRDFVWYRAEINKLLQKHFDNFGRFHYSVAESGWDTWLDGYVPGAPNRKVSIYNEGALLSLVLDLRIRNNSNNKASLHNVMSDLNHDHGGRTGGYSVSDFQLKLEKYCGENLDEFFSHYYFGNHSFEPILTEALGYAGLDIKMEKNPSSSLEYLGVKTSRSGDKLIVTQISPGSTAELGGMMMMDEIAAINGEPVAEDFDSQLNEHKKGEVKLEINRLGRKLEVNCPNTNKSYFPLYTIIKAKAPSNLAKRIFKKWCGTEWDSVD